MTAASFNHFVAVSNVLFTFRCVSLCVTSHVVQMVHLRRFALATMMMVMVGVVAGSGLVCMQSSDSNEMANSKCALAFEDNEVCDMHAEKWHSLDSGGRSAKGCSQQ